MPVILVVEDDPEIRNYIIESLELKYRIFSAENGKEGIKKATKIKLVIRNQIKSV